MARSRRAKKKDNEEDDPVYLKMWKSLDMARNQRRAASKSFHKALAKQRTEEQKTKTVVTTEDINVPPKKPLRFRKEWEAEELRKGLERLCSDADRSADIDRDEPCVRVADIEHLLDMVDAKDSLQYLERKERAPNRQYG